MVGENQGNLINEIKIRHQDVVSRIAQAALSVNRKPGDIKLLVVTKAQSIEVADAVISAGCNILGENYVEEAQRKIKALENRTVSWHMIGHIQSRKTRQVCKGFAWVHSIDRFKVARRLNQGMEALGKRLPVLIQVNVSGEASKYGYPAWDENKWQELNRKIEPLLALTHLDIRGLMTIPPWDPDPEASRPFYQRLKSLQTYLSDQFPQRSWEELSMGMSNDFEVAVQEGATFVRIGTAIVGQRD